MKITWFSKFVALSMVPNVRHHMLAFNTEHKKYIWGILTAPVFIKCTQFSPLIHSSVFKYKIFGFPAEAIGLQQPFLNKNWWLEKVKKHIILIGVYGPLNVLWYLANFHSLFLKYCSFGKIWKTAADVFIANWWL